MKIWARVPESQEGRKVKGQERLILRQASVRMEAMCCCEEAKMTERQGPIVANAEARDGKREGHMEVRQSQESGRTRGQRRLT